MTAWITPRTHAHADSTAAYRDVHAVLTQEAGSDAREIREETALAIASWFQSPGYDGDAFASLASGLPTDVPRLLDQIHRARPNAEPQDQLALDCLATWVLNHPSRK